MTNDDPGPKEDRKALPALTLVIAVAGLGLAIFGTCQAVSRQSADTRTQVEILLDDAWTYLEAGNLRNARLQVRLASVHLPRDARVGVFQGLIANESRQPTGAERHFREALAEDPDCVAAHLHLGLLLQEEALQQPAVRTQLLSEASEHLSDAERLSKTMEQTPEATRTAVLIALAGVRADEGVPKEVEKLYDDALVLSPEDPVVLASQANYFAKTGRWVDSIGKYCQAIRLQPDDPDLWSALSGVRYLADDLDGAESAIRRRLELVPTDPASHKFLGLILFEQGHLDEAAAIEEIATRACAFVGS